MREKVSADRVEQFMKAIGRAGKKDARIYFVGGATAVLLGWRETTIDLDVKIIPEADEILRALPHLKEDLLWDTKLSKLKAKQISSIPVQRCRSRERRGLLPDHPKRFDTRVLLKYT